MKMTGVKMVFFSKQKGEWERNFCLQLFTFFANFGKGLLFRVL